MRRVHSIEDVNDVLRELYGFVDNLRSKDINMEKRRTVNASPSREKYDYVVRKELDDLRAIIDQQSLPIRGMRRTISFAFLGTPPNGTLSSPPYIADFSMQPLALKAAAVFPSAIDGEFNIRLNGERILADNFIFPGGTGVLEVITIPISGTTFIKDDTVCIETISNGGTRRICFSIVTVDL